MSITVGAMCVATVYAALLSAGVAPQIALAIYPVAIAGGLLLAGPTLFDFQRGRPNATRLREGSALLAGAVVMLGTGAAFWRSGSMTSEGMAFYGPMSRDHIYHLALIARLDVQVPPDNFLVADYPFPAYHFLSDLLQVFARNASLGFLDPFDLYFRLYPSVAFFCLGVLGYKACARISGTCLGGWLGVAFVVFGSDLSWLPGVMRVVTNLSQPELATARLFSPWYEWNSFGSTLPLVHRPAYYHGLLQFLGGCVILLIERFTARAWLVSGAIWGLMAGFNYTLAATVGLAAMTAAAISYSTKRRPQAKTFAVCAGAIALGSIPANLVVLASRTAARSQDVLSWAPGSFAVRRWAAVIPESVGSTGTLLLSVALLVGLSYGLRLAGLPKMMTAQLRFKKHQPLALLLAVAAATSFAVGMLFAFRGPGGISNNIIFLQPTGWILGLFALVPIVRLMRGGHRVGQWLIVIAVLFGIVQSFLAFNFANRIVISPATLAACEFVRTRSNPIDVVAFVPNSLVARGILGPDETLNNFYIPAFTGLRGYFSSENYTLLAIDAPDSEKVYRERYRTVLRIAQGSYSPSLLDDVKSHGVRWLFMPNVGSRSDPSGVVAYRNPEVVVLDLNRWER